MPRRGATWLNPLLISNGNQTLPRNTEAENAIVGTVIAVTSVVGLIANVTAIVFALRLRSRRSLPPSQFSIIFVSLACGDIGVLLIFLFWTAPILYTGSALAFDPIATGVVNFLISTPFYASGYSTMVMAVNRYVAVCRPVEYAQIYEPRRLRLKLAACWLVAACCASIGCHPDCGMYVDPSAYTWVYPRTVCGLVCNFGVDAIPNVSIFVVATVISIVTFVKLRRIRRSRVTLVLSRVAPFIDVEGRKREVAFVLQSCMNCSIFVTMMLLFHAVVPFCTEKWLLFWLDTFAWNASHAINGIVYLFLIPDVRRSLLRCLGLRGRGPRVEPVTFIDARRRMSVNVLEIMAESKVVVTAL